ncbi:hypothetical protein LZ30DRAFT_214153 [Colletotrichum cereale]|nr:hypothetical protein LZ30DRAFT_214153 [Colletotrichum cereale]
MKLCKARGGHVEWSRVLGPGRLLQHGPLPGGGAMGQHGVSSFASERFFSPLGFATIQVRRQPRLFASQPRRLQGNDPGSSVCFSSSSLIAGLPAHHPSVPIVAPVFFFYQLSVTGWACEGQLRSGSKRRQQTVFKSLWGGDYRGEWFRAGEGSPFGRTTCLLCYPVSSRRGGRGKDAAGLSHHD